MIGLLILSACAAVPALIEMNYEVSDLPAEQRIRLSYRNDIRHDVCLLPEMWPNQAGKINQASDVAFLVAGIQRFPIENFNTGYCIGGCALRLHPGDQTSAFISYKDFNLPERLREQAKQLEFKPKAVRC